MKNLNRINSIKLILSDNGYQLFEVSFPKRYYITFRSCVKYSYIYKSSALKKYYLLVCPWIADSFEEVSYG